MESYFCLYLSFSTVSFYNDIVMINVCVFNCSSIIFVVCLVNMIHLLSLQVVHSLFIVLWLGQFK